MYNVYIDVFCMVGLVTFGNFCLKQRNRYPGVSFNFFKVKTYLEGCKRSNTFFWVTKTDFEIDCCLVREKFRVLSFVCVFYVSRFDFRKLMSHVCR